MPENTLPKHWRWSTLGALASSKSAIVSGPFGSNISSRFFVPDGVPVIRGNNLTTDLTRFLDEGFVFLTAAKAAEFKNCEAIADDLVFTAAGSLGQVGIIPRNAKYPTYIISNKQLRARVDQGIIEPLFAFYWLASPAMVTLVQQLNTGSSVPLINLGVLRGLPVPLPPLPEQRAIARILGALDDKIELNRQMNHTLEAIARAVFKSWFVDFDPVRAKAEGRDPGVPADVAALFPNRLVDSELGEIPEGWEVGRLGDVAEQRRDGVQATQLQAHEAYIGLEHMPRQTIALHAWDTAADLESNKYRFREGDILFGKLRPYFHKVGVAPVSGVCSTDIVVLGPLAEPWFALVLGHVSSVEFVNYTDGMSSGTKMPRTNWPDMASYSIIIPPAEIASRLTEIVRPIVWRIAAGIHESRTLAELRDTLLPKLMSGELRVPDAAELVEEVAG